MNILKNINKPNSVKTTKIIRSIQATAVTLAGTAFAAGKPVLAFVLTAAAGAADIILSAFDNGDSSKTDGND